MTSDIVDVSVIIATYNSDLIKIKRTIQSVVTQQGCSFEIIVTDDGSKEFPSKEIEEVLSNSGIKYLILKNEVNVGTVKNLYSALSRAKGKYVYGVSPGDMIYDQFVLRDFYEYCENNDIDICFGNALYYTYKDEKPVLMEFSKPEKPAMYKKNRCRLAMLTSNYICGVAFFRKREVFIEKLREVMPYCRLVEDYSTTLLSLASGIDVVYYDRNIAFYEYGAGVSTNWDNPLSKIVPEDCHRILYYLTSKYSNNELLAARKLQMESDDRKEYIKYVCLHQPKIAALLLITQLIPTRKIKFTDYDTELLNSYF